MMLFRAFRLALAIRSAFPDVPPHRATRAAMAITIAADGEDPFLIAAIAYGESRFVATARNARTGCAGPMGVRRFSGGEVDGYRAGVRVLREARRWCARRGTPTDLCALSAYASGPRGPRLRLYRGPRAVIARRERLRAAMGAES